MVLTQVCGSVVERDFSITSQGGSVSVFLMSWCTLLLRLKVYKLNVLWLLCDGEVKCHGPVVDAFYTFHPFLITLSHAILLFIATYDDQLRVVSLSRLAFVSKPFSVAAPLRAFEFLCV